MLPPASLPKIRHPPPVLPAPVHRPRLLSRRSTVLALRPPLPLNLILRFPVDSRLSAPTSAISSPATPLAPSSPPPSSPPPPIDCHRPAPPSPIASPAANPAPPPATASPFPFDPRRSAPPPHSPLLPQQHFFPWPAPFQHPLLFQGFGFRFRASSFAAACLPVKREQLTGFTVSGSRIVLSGSVLGVRVAYFMFRV
jgi:hypothetical protein